MKMPERGHMHGWVICDVEGCPGDFGTKLRDAAVCVVDALVGYTLEFSHSQDSHRLMYDQAERILRDELVPRERHAKRAEPVPDYFCGICGSRHASGGPDPHDASAPASPEPEDGERDCGITDCFTEPSRDGLCETHYRDVAFIRERGFAEGVAAGCESAALLLDSSHPHIAEAIRALGRKR